MTGRTTGGWIAGYGVNVQSWVGSKPTGLDNDWVNSIYAQDGDGDYVEAGWYWKRSFGVRPRAFMVCRVPEIGFYREWNHVTDPDIFPDITLPVRERVSISLSNTGGDDTYEVWFQGNRAAYITDTRIFDSAARVGAERYSLNYANTGSWTSVRYLARSGSTYTWTYWPNAWRADPVAPVLQDPEYTFRKEHIDSSDHWVYVDNYDR